MDVLPYSQNRVCDASHWVIIQSFTMLVVSCLARKTILISCHSVVSAIHTRWPYSRQKDLSPFQNNNIAYCRLQYGLHSKTLINCPIIGHLLTRTWIDFRCWMTKRSMHLKKRLSLRTQVWCKKPWCKDVCVCIDSPTFTTHKHGGIIRVLYNLALEVDAFRNWIVTTFIFIFLWFFIVLLMYCEWK